MAKQTKAEVDQRVNDVYQWIILRFSHSQILRSVALKWGETPNRTVDWYVKKARDLLQVELSGDRKQFLAEHIATRNQLYQKAYAQKRYQTALNILDSTAKLQGLFITLDQAIEVVTAHDFTVTDSSAIAQDESESKSEGFNDLIEIPEQSIPSRPAGTSSI